MMKYFRLGFKEVLNNKKFTTFFVINLALGLSGFIALDAFKGGIERALHERSKGILAADIGFGARRPLADNEKATADTILQGYVDRVEVFETYSMLAGPQRSRLVEVKAVDDAYPFYGEIELASGTLIARGGAKQLS